MLPQQPFAAALHIDLFGRDRLQVILFEDFASDPRQVTLDILRFLGKSGSREKFEYPVVNASSECEWLRHLKPFPGDRPLPASQ